MFTTTFTTTVVRRTLQKIVLVNCSITDCNFKSSALHFTFENQHYHQKEKFYQILCCPISHHQAEMAHLKNDNDDCLEQQQQQKTTSKPMLRFGVVADVQYADSDDRQAWYNPAKTRFYRNSLKQVEKAFEHWEKVEDTLADEPETCPVSFILQLGDIIDKLNTEACSHTAIDRTLACFLNNPKMPTFHTLGNHELYNFDRAAMSYLFDKYLFEHSHSEHSFGVNNPKAALSTTIDGDTSSHPLYYKFYPADGVKFISLDTYDISVLGYAESHPKFQLAAALLEKYHGHRDQELWDTDQALRPGPDRRFQASNGALSEEQLAWLDAELADSDLQQEIVVVFGHVGLHPGSCGWDSLLWNYERVLQIFGGHRCVVAYFSGHAHNAGYAEEDGIHYVVYHGVIETAPTEDCFATVSLFADPGGGRLVVDGRGVEQSLTLPFTAPDKRRKEGLKLSTSEDNALAVDGCGGVGEDGSSAALEELPETTVVATVGQCVMMEVEVEV